MPVFDASSALHAWDNYPERQFPPLWNWIAREIDGRRIAMPRVACDEVARKAPECADWLRARGIDEYEVSNAITQHAMLIKGSLGIVGDNYHPNGVGENDIIIVATARGCKKFCVNGHRVPTELGLARRTDDQRQKHRQRAD